MAAPHNDNIKKKIFDSALKLLNEKSFSKVTLAEIAKSANVSKGSVYYYYKSKDDILYDITDTYLQDYYERLLIWVEDSHKDTSLPRLINYIMQYGINDPTNGIRLRMIADAIDGNSSIREKLLERYKIFKDIIGEKIAQRKEDENQQYYGWLILTIVDGLMLQLLLGNNDIDADEFVKKFVEEMSK